MTPDAADMHDEVRKLRDEVGELKTTTRVTKHDVANLQQTMGFINTRLDKIQDQATREAKETRDIVSTEIRQLSERMASETKLLSSEISAINTKHERGVGFFAGIGCVFVGACALIMFILKLAFPGFGQ